MKNVSLFFLPFFFVVNIASAAVDCANLKQKVDAQNKNLYQGLVQEVLTESGKQGL